MSLDPWVLTLESLAPEDEGRVGGKAARLGALRAAGFPVPPGICLTTDAFRLALDPYETAISNLLARTDLSDPPQARLAADRIGAALEEWRIPPPAWADLNAALPVVEAAGPLAVRSSATAEDRGDVS